MRNVILGFCVQNAAPRKQAPANAKPAKTPKAQPAKPREKKEKAAAAEGGPKPKAKRAKKDKNAPKGALTAFMFFSNANREQVDHVHSTSR